MHASSKGSESETTKTHEPVVIILLARMRTGSSFLGEIFNQNPSFFCLFEPLVSIDRFIRTGEVMVNQRQNLSSSLLLDYSQCRFPKKPAEDWIAWNEGLARNTRLSQSCPRTKSGHPECRNVITIRYLVDICRGVGTITCCHLAAKQSILTT